MSTQAIQRVIVLARKGLPVSEDDADMAEMELAALRSACRKVAVDGTARAYARLSYSTLEECGREDEP